jgi:membrane protein YdbS with pleckstrin-like domain
VPFPKELLTDDEELVLDLRPHWWYIAPAGAYLAVALVIGLYVWLGGGDNAAWKALGFVVGLAILVAVGFFVQRYARWVSTNFVVTNERLIARRGVVAKKGIEIPLDRINTVFFNQSFFERIIDAGDLGVESAGEGGRETFSDIRKPNMVQHEIYRQKENFEKRRMVQMGQTFASNVPQGGMHHGPSIPEQIEHLDRLRRGGTITEDEFQAKKAELLRRM